MHQHPHSHMQHEPSRHIQRPDTLVDATAAAGLELVNPRILDASIRDVTERLSNEQKAEVLIHAMHLLKLANPFSHHIVENGVISCLQAANLGTPQRVQALLLRGRARMSAGDMAGARNDLYKVLELVPDHAVATSLLSIPSSSGPNAKNSRLWNIESASRRLSPELWRQVASFLSRRDLKMLLQIPHVLSRIAFERVFQTVDLHIGTLTHMSARGLSGFATLTDGRGEFCDYDNARVDEPDSAVLQLEKQLSQRTADIVARIVLDPAFAKLIKTVRIFAGRRDKSDHMAFRSTMLATALPKLLNLREFVFSGSIDVWNRLAVVLSTTHPRLQSLTIEPQHERGVDGVTEPTLPHVTHLTQVKVGTSRGAHALPSFLAANRTTLRKLCLCTPAASLPAASAITLANLTHLEFVGTVGGPGAGAGELDAVGLILAYGEQLVSLRMACVLRTDVSQHFHTHAHALPKLKRFGFRAALDGPPTPPPHVNGIINGYAGPSASAASAAATHGALFPAIAEFLRAHADLEKLELDVVSGGDRAPLGYDASVLGVLPNLPHLRQLAVRVTDDASPGLLAWILPRGLTALSLSGVPGRGVEHFLNTMRPGLPTNLRYLALLDTAVRAHEVVHVVEAALPRSVRLLAIADAYYTAHRRGDGRLQELEAWPPRRAALHAPEWLEALGCEDALWDDFAPGCCWDMNKYTIQDPELTADIV